MKPTEYHTTSIPMKPPTEYRTVKQPENSSICGACIVAMITGHDLTKVQAEMQPTTRDGHTYYKDHEIIRYLATQGITTGINLIPLDNPVHPKERIRLHWQFPNNPAMLAVKSRIHKNADHWVLWDGKHVRDSSWANQDNTNKLSDYHILGIIPITYYLPNDTPLPAELHKEDCPCTTCVTIREHE